MFLELQKEMCFVPTKKSGEKIKKTCVWPNQQNPLLDQIFNSFFQSIENLNICFEHIWLHTQNFSQYLI